MDMKPGDYRRIACAIRFLAEHYDTQPRLDTAARVAGLSPFHFQRLFTRYAGVSPKAFVGHLTLERAKAALAEGTSVFDAALTAGLSGPSRLHDLCLKVEAMTPGAYARGGAGLVVRYGFHESPFGRALIMTTPKGVCGLAFCEDDGEAALLADMCGRWPRAAYREDAAHTEKIAHRIFQTRKGALTLHLLGTPWQIKVWQALLAVRTPTTYGALAKSLNAPRAARAVGAAIGRNPIGYLIPCHRVLAGDGSLHGYHWGCTRKRALLALEAAHQDEEAQDREESTHKPRTSVMV
jgi:AraC family transcriptional regulator of adaptative response/methylated-DNA-[protein]-cysteine methyltransferase